MGKTICIYEWGRYTAVKTLELTQELVSRFNIDLKENFPDEEPFTLEHFEEAVNSNVDYDSPEGYVREWLSDHFWDQAYDTVDFEGDGQDYSVQNLS